MKKQLLTLFLVLLIGIPTGVALAHGRGHNGGYDKFMMFFDADKDGVVTRAEFSESSDQRFAKMDSDSSGTISTEEFSQYIQERRQERRQRSFKHMDTNADGRVGLDEYLDVKRERAERRFKSIDKDANGMISAEEFTALKYGRKKHSGKRIFGRLDDNSDGQIDKEESQAAWLNWFKRLDINGDQVVTVEEVRAAHVNR
ncbi:MAG: hypothetical protein E2O38_12005 [Proteobacteria bacterium]|jgi:Ca2+-binding EF-hand superfamily protein|nr:MAG: hypothetical protein E2O38_12005 [Pseudomonadota bacterium]